MANTIAQVTLTGSGTFTVPAGVTKLSVFSKASLSPELQASSSYIVRLTQTGAAYAWGINTLGQLGVGDLIPRSSPVAVVGGLTFSQIAQGGNHTVALTVSGKAYTWGYNEHGQLGTGQSNAQLFSASSPVAVVGGLTFVQVAANAECSFGLTASGQVYAWGANEYGNLGDGTTVPKSSPVAVIGGLSFTKISSHPSAHHTVGLTASGQIYSWGGNYYGQLGDGTTMPKSSPVAVLGGLTFSRISVGGFSTFALGLNGAAYSWGGNINYTLGDGTNIPKSSPVAVVGGLTFDDISAGYTHTLAKTENGTIYSWGSNTYGQLGDGTVTTRSSPTLVLGGLKASTVQSGITASNAATNGGKLYSWGDNTHGRLGDGTVISKSSPVAVLGGLFFPKTGKVTFEAIISVTPGESITYSASTGAPYYERFFSTIATTQTADSFIVEYAQ